MCPWPRIQAALTDEYAFNVTYRFDRGEPRMSAKKATAAIAKGDPAGDCVDCHQCVAVCPTGVDIRDGPNLGCIQCGLCIDACDTIMTKLHRPTRLIAYDTDVNIRRRLEGQPATSRFVRPRTLLYSVLIVAVGALMVWTLATRAPTSINVIHDRNPEYVLLTTGGVRNAYTLRILNKHNDARRFAVSVEGLTGASLEVVGAARENGENIVDVGPDQTREVRAIISTSERVSGSEPIVFAIRDLADDSIARAADNFRGPNTEGNGQ
jgi:cytochrome c oxidase accessory protein FixG